MRHLCLSLLANACQPALHSGHAAGEQAQAMAVDGHPQHSPGTTDPTWDDPDDDWSYGGSKELPYDGLDNDGDTFTRDDDLDRDGF